MVTEAKHRDAGWLTRTWLGLGLAVWAGLTLLTGGALLAGRGAHQPVLAVVGGQGPAAQDVYLIDPRGPALNLTKRPANYSSLCWSADGRWLAYLVNIGERVDLFVLDMQTGTRRDLTAGAYPLTLLDTPAWSPDGRWITIAAVRQLTAFDPATGEAWELLPLYPLGPTYVDPAWAPDGVRLAFVQEALDGMTRRLTLLDTVTGTLHTLEHDTRVVGELAWSPDGAWLVYTSLKTGDYELFALHLTSGEVRNLTRYPGYDAGAVWSPDGRFIAFVTDRWGSGDIYATTLTPGDLRRLTFSASFSLAPAWSPDGDWLAYRAGGPAMYSYTLDLRSGFVRRLEQLALVQNFPAWWP